MKKRREEHISRCEMRANWILSTFFSTSYYYEHTPQQLTYSAGLKKLFLSTTKTQPPTSSYSPKQQSCCFVVLHRISRKQQNSFVVRPRTNLNAILRSTLKTSGQNLNNTQWLTHDDAHKGGQKKKLGKIWLMMQVNENSKAWLWKHSHPSRSFVFSSCWMLLLSAVGAVHAPLSFHLRLESKNNISTKMLTGFSLSPNNTKQSKRIWRGSKEE